MVETEESSCAKTGIETRERRAVVKRVEARMVKTGR